MDDDREIALNEALAAELRLAHAKAGGLSAPKLEELTGIGSDTIRRTLKGGRAATAVELIKYGDVMGFDVGEMIDAARAAADATLGRPTSQQSTRLRDKLSLLASAAGKTTDTIYFDVVNHVSKQGFHFPRPAWEEVLSGSGVAVRREVLFAIAGALDVEPRFLTADDPEIDREVEGRLRFQRAMIDLGVEEAAVRALREPTTEDIEAVQRAVERAINEGKRR